MTSAILKLEKIRIFNCWKTEDVQKNIKELIDLNYKIEIFQSLLLLMISKNSRWMDEKLFFVCILAFNCENYLRWIISWSLIVRKLLVHKMLLKSFTTNWRVWLAHQTDYSWASLISAITFLALSWTTQMTFHVIKIYPNWEKKFSSATKSIQ